MYGPCELFRTFASVETSSGGPQHCTLISALRNTESNWDVGNRSVTIWTQTLVLSLSPFFFYLFVSCVFVWASNDWSLQKDACDDELFLNVFIWSLSGSVTSMLQRTQESHP